MSEQEPSPQNIIPAPGERGSERWSWRNALIGMGMGVIGGVVISEVLSLLTGLNFEERNYLPYLTSSVVGGLLGILWGGIYPRVPGDYIS